jgi:hypothetical protein
MSKRLVLYCVGILPILPKATQASTFLTTTIYNNSLSSCSVSLGVTHFTASKGTQHKLGIRHVREGSKLWAAASLPLFLPWLYPGMMTPPVSTW